MQESKFSILLFDLDDIAFNLSCAVNNLLAIHCVMTEGGLRSEEFTDALYCCYTTLEGHSQKLRAAVDCAYAAEKKERCNG